MSVEASGWSASGRIAARALQRCGRMALLLGGSPRGEGEKEQERKRKKIGEGKKRKITVREAQRFAIPVACYGIGLGPPARNRNKNRKNIGSASRGPPPKNRQNNCPKNRHLGPFSYLSAFVFSLFSGRGPREAETCSVAGQRDCNQRSKKDFSTTFRFIPPPPGKGPQ